MGMTPFPLLVSADFSTPLDSSTVVYDNHRPRNVHPFPPEHLANLEQNGSYSTTNHEYVHRGSVDSSADEDHDNATHQSYYSTSDLRYPATSAENSPVSPQHQNHEQILHHHNHHHQHPQSQQYMHAPISAPIHLATYTSSPTTYDDTSLSRYTFPPRRSDSAHPRYDPLTLPPSIPYNPLLQQQQPQLPSSASPSVSPPMCSFTLGHRHRVSDSSSYNGDVSTPPSSTTTTAPPLWIPKQEDEESHGMAGVGLRYRDHQHQQQSSDAYTSSSSYDQLHSPVSPSSYSDTAAPPALSSGSANESSKTYSFVSLPGNTIKKRPRRRYDEIERLYRCSWPACTKAYGTLNHLNAHVSMQRHGVKRTPGEFKELRKEWRSRKKDAHTVSGTKSIVQQLPPSSSPPTSHHSPQLISSDFQHQPQSLQQPNGYWPPQVYHPQQQQSQRPQSHHLIPLSLGPPTTVTGPGAPPQPNRCGSLLEDIRYPPPERGYQVSPPPINRLPPDSTLLTPLPGYGAKARFAGGYDGSRDFE